MAFKVVWSAPALKDLEQISDFVSRDSFAYASAVVTKILDGVDRLEMFPEAGRRVPEFDRDDTREILVYQWRVIYQPGKGRIDIVAIVHGAQRRRPN
jgi:toxin ParE1/3/4